MITSTYHPYRRNEMTFNKDAFLHSTVDKKLSTERIHVPGGVYMAKAGKPVAREANRKDGSGKIYFCDIPWEIIGDDAKLVAETTKRPKNTVRQSMILDLDENGDLDFSDGMNTVLGATLEAVGLNDGTSTPAMIEGQTAVVKVSDPKREGDYPEIRAVAAVGSDV